MFQSNNSVISPFYRPPLTRIEVSRDGLLPERCRHPKIITLPTTRAKSLRLCVGPTVRRFPVSPSISGCTFERVVNISTILRRRIDKSVSVFLFIHWLQKEAFVTRLRLVFDQNSCRALDSPHFEPCAEDSSIRVKLIQTRHGMEAIDGDPVLSVKARWKSTRLNSSHRR